MFEHLDTFGHWIAGFVDGEGSFNIGHSAQYGSTYWCSFKLSQRDDDAAIIYQIHDAWCQIGNLTTLAPRGASAPQIVLTVNKLDECELLRDFFIEYPLRAKKARDLEVWSRGLAELRQWRTSRDYDWSRMRELRNQLVNGRLYPVAESSLIGTY